MGKGSKRRPGNQAAYREAYAKIYGWGSYCECGVDLEQHPKHKCKGISPKNERSREDLQDALDEIPPRFDVL